MATLLSAGCLRSAQAFSVSPNPSAASGSFIPSVTYKLKDGTSGVITRQPIAFVSISSGGTKDFINELKTEFPESKGWKFLSAEDDLKGSFSVNTYYVNQKGTGDVIGCGGGFAFDYIPSKTDPVSNRNTELHWIQRVVSNHKKSAEHGMLENAIISKSLKRLNTRPDVPFFDVVRKESKSSAIPPHYEYDAGKVDPENDHQWNAEVYLTSINKKDPKTVTIYNGVSWGWENRINAETDPATNMLLKVQP